MTSTDLGSTDSGVNAIQDSDRLEAIANSKLIALDALRGYYDDPARHYHSWRHIHALRSWLSRFHHLVVHHQAVNAAIWFHDAVYDTHRQDNEQLSAKLARAELGKLQWPAALIDKVALMVEATAGHRGEGADSDTQLFLDLDLSVLGQSEGAYDVYMKGIRAEYAWVEDAAYRAGRTKVLEEFLGRKSIYFTPALIYMWEGAARKNLSREISLLASGDPIARPQSTLSRAP